MVTRKKEPVKKDDKIEVNAGNVPLVTVQLLNSINQRLIQILEELKRG